MAPPWVGLAGGIGAGKSQVARLLVAQGGVLHLDTDALYHDLLRQDTGLVAAIAARFGPAVRGPAGGLDRAALRRALTANPAGFPVLEALAHPRILAEVARRAQAAPPGTAYVLVEAPLLFESGLDRQVQRIVVVTAPLDLRFARVAATRGLDRAAFDAIVARQLPQDEAAARAHHVLPNDADLSTLEAHVSALHQDLLRALGRPQG